MVLQTVRLSKCLCMDVTPLLPLLQAPCRSKKVLNPNHSATVSQTHLRSCFRASTPKPPNPYLSLLVPCISCPHATTTPETLLNRSLGPRIEFRLLSLALRTPWDGLQLTPPLQPFCLTAPSAPFPPALLDHLTLPKHTLYFSILLCLHRTLLPICFLLLFIVCLANAKFRASVSPGDMESAVCHGEMVHPFGSTTLHDEMLRVHWLIISSQNEVTFIGVASPFMKAKNIESGRE